MSKRDQSQVVHERGERADTGLHLESLQIGVVDCVSPVNDLGIEIVGFVEGVLDFQAGSEGLEASSKG